MRIGSAILALALLLSVSPLLRAQDDSAERIRIHGSNLLGNALVPNLAHQWMADIGYQNIKRRRVGASRTEVIGVRDGEWLVVEIDRAGTASGLAAIVEGKAEIAMSSRRPNAAEVEAAWQLGDLRSPDQEWVLGIDGLSVLVPVSNRRSEISAAQLRQVLSGTAKDWAMLAGKPGPIRVHTVAASGTHELLSNMVMSRARMPALKGHRNYAEVVAAVRADPNAIGIVSLRAPRGGLKALAIRSGDQAVLPDRLSAGAEDYPLQRRLYFHTGQLITALGRSFAQYAVSSAGQAVVERSQFVSLKLQVMSPNGLARMPAAYKDIVGTSGRLPTTFHFSSGTDLFDSRGRQDIERLATFLQLPKNSNRKIVLLGFANRNSRDPYQSLSLSQERVDFVANELLAMNLKVVTVRGLGGRMNLIDHKDPAARSRNERVEVWVR